MWDFEDVVIWVLGLILAGICVVIIGGIVFFGFDSIGIEGEPTSAVVLNTKFVPETTLTSFITVGNIQVPQIETYPDSWNAAVRTNDGRVVTCEISQGQYSVLVKGSSVEVGVGSGRMSGGSYCTYLTSP